ncbi:MAG: biotin-dependent carboxyltransferase family protein [Rhodobacterales bacterium]|jgi:5-oxoprolinase (ATP-hydrolysing) subunit C|nr:biotin-dependent carboxyltransferase family protein [Pseudomonadota bacterium]MDA1285592.1 biotin-dependent carboxyltransferase family protein [Pseudomonadota bacterium]
MTAELIIQRAGPSLTVQDFGRLGYLSQGLSRGGAADRLALVEGVALLGQTTDHAALEMAGYGGEFTVTASVRIALTGAPMLAQLDDQMLVWNASHLMKPGQILRIGAAQNGVYGYLHFGGGIATDMVLGSRASHLTAGLGTALKAGDRLPLAPDATQATGLHFTPRNRCSGGVVRIIQSAQTHMFSEAQQKRFTETVFEKTTHANRQGAELAFEGAPFATEDQLSILSQIIVPGDIQMTGSGAPFVLLPECQTTGGYPRIGTVLPDDLPLVAQASPGSRLQFRFVTLDEGLTTYRTPDETYREVRRHIHPLIRDPREMHDLLSYQLIGGVTRGDE